MKKRLFIGFLVLAFVFALTGCKANRGTPDNEGANNIQKGSVVVYFSATGKTKDIAERIANKSGSDIIEIIPKEKYKDEDLTYDVGCRSHREQNDANARPEIENTIDLSKYDTVYLGYPIWYGTSPKIIRTLIDTNDFDDKTIIPFCTSDNSDIVDSVNDLKNYNTKLNFKEGKRFSADDGDETIEEFIKNN